MAKKVKRRSSLSFVVILLLIFGGFFWISKEFSSFDPQTILDKSILKEKTFETEVVEIVSPKNGIKAYLFFDRTNPIISINFMFKKTGLAYEFKGKKGISNLAAGLLKDGAGKLDSQSFKEELEAKAIVMSFGTSLDYFEGSLLTTSEHKEKAYEMLALALTQPRFELKDIKRAKEQTKVLLMRQTEHPASVLGLEFSKEVFGSHPYSNNPIGVWEDIESISQKDLKDFVKNKFSQDVLIIGIAGDISAEEAGKVLDKIFGELPKTGKHEEILEAEIDFDGRRVDVDGNAAQSISMFAARGVARLDKDFYPLYIANHIFGGAGLSSRLSLSVREQEGLTYSIYSYLSNNEKANLIKGGFSSTPENVARVFEIFEDQWNKMGKGVSQKELDEAKNYLVASYNLRFASIEDIASILTAMQKENLGIDFLKRRNSYVQNVNLDDVNNVATGYFKSNNLIFVSIGKN